jgi:hypothetical protein
MKTYVDYSDLKNDDSIALPDEQNDEASSGNQGSGSSSTSSSDTTSSANSGTAVITKSAGNTKTPAKAEKKNDVSAQTAVANSNAKIKEIQQSQLKHILESFNATLRSIPFLLPQKDKTSTAFSIFSVLNAKQVFVNLKTPIASAARTVGSKLALSTIEEAIMSFYNTWQSIQDSIKDPSCTAENLAKQIESLVNIQKAISITQQEFAKTNKTITMVVTTIGIVTTVIGLSLTITTLALPSVLGGVTLGVALGAGNAFAVASVVMLAIGGAFLLGGIAYGLGNLIYTAYTNNKNKLPDGKEVKEVNPQIGDSITLLNSIVDEKSKEVNRAVEPEKAEPLKNAKEVDNSVLSSRHLVVDASKTTPTTALNSNIEGGNSALSDIFSPIQKLNMPDKISPIRHPTSSLIQNGHMSVSPFKPSVDGGDIAQQTAKTQPLSTIQNTAITASEPEPSKEVDQTKDPKLPSTEQKAPPQPDITGGNPLLHM